MSFGELLWYILKLSDIAVHLSVLIVCHVVRYDCSIFCK